MEARNTDRKKERKYKRKRREKRGTSNISRRHTDSRKEQEKE